MNKAQLFTALNTYATARVTLIQKLIAAGYPTIESARPHVMDWVATKVADVAVKVQGSGRLVFVGDGASSARSVLLDINNALMGTASRGSKAGKVSHKAAPLTKAQKAAVAALLEVFGGDVKAARAAVM